MFSPPLPLAPCTRPHRPPSPRPAQTFFVVLSGFLLQFTAPSDFGLVCTPLQLLRWYARRVGRVLIVAWPATLIAIPLSAGLADSVRRQQVSGFRETATCFLMVHDWSPTVEMCPNRPLWTVHGLVCAWLLFPLSNFALQMLQSRLGLAGLLVPALLLATAMPLQFWIFESTFGPEGVASHAEIDSTWVPSVVADFTLGMLSAAIARRHEEFHPRVIFARARCSYSARGLVADLCAAAYLLWGLLFLGPYTASTAAPALSGGLVHGTSRTVAPMVALFMYASAGGDGAGLVTRVLGHPALVSLGELSMAMYLTHWPLASLFVSLGGDACLYSPLGSLRYVATLLVLSALVTEYVEKPAVRVLLVCAGGECGRARERDATPSAESERHESEGYERKERAEAGAGGKCATM